MDKPLLSMFAGVSPFQVGRLGPQIQRKTFIFNLQSTVHHPCCSAQLRHWSSQRNNRNEAFRWCELTFTVRSICEVRVMSLAARSSVDASIHDSVGGPAQCTVVWRWWRCSDEIQIVRQVIRRHATRRSLKLVHNVRHVMYSAPPQILQVSARSTVCVHRA